LGGPKYALLSAAYSNAPRYDFCEAVRSIGIFMGGADAIDASSAVLDGIKEIDFQGRIEVVTTSANPNLTSLKEKLLTYPQADLSLDLPDLASFFARHDLQIGAGGGATWERCMIGTPTLAIICADNQRHVLIPLAQHGVASILDWTDQPFGNGLVDALQSLIADKMARLSMSQAAMKLVDGQGCKRVAAAILG
jgi:UDP-2,4-diacetamido-2,4,6-trideoxy-beta-L-altropyranose hydrolase